MGIYNTILAVTYSALELCLSLTNQQSKAKFIIIFFNSTYRKPVKDKGSVLATRKFDEKYLLKLLVTCPIRRPLIYSKRKTDQWEVTLCRLTPNPLSHGQLNKSHKKSCLLQDLISRPADRKVGLMVELSRTRKGSVQSFYQVAVTYRSIPIPWLIFITAMIASYLPYMLGKCG